MPVRPNGMTIDAKIRHHAFGVINRSDASGALIASSLYDPDRRIVISKVFAETTEAHLVAAGAYTLGTAADVDKYATPITVAVSGDTIGDFTEGTVLAAGRDIPPDTRIIAAHTQSANAGEAILHIWYYVKDNSGAVQEA